MILDQYNCAIGKMVKVSDEIAEKTIRQVDSPWGDFRDGKPFFKENEWLVAIEYKLVEVLFLIGIYEVGVRSAKPEEVVPTYLQVMSS